MTTMTDNDLIEHYDAIPPPARPIVDTPGVNETIEIRQGKHDDVRIARALITGTVAVRGWWPVNKDYDDIHGIVDYSAQILNPDHVAALSAYVKGLN